MEGKGGLWGGDRTGWKGRKDPEQEGQGGAEMDGRWGKVD